MKKKIKIDRKCLECYYWAGKSFPVYKCYVSDCPAKIRSLTKEVKGRKNKMKKKIQTNKSKPAKKEFDATFISNKEDKNQSDAMFWEEYLVDETQNS